MLLLKSSQKNLNIYIFFIYWFVFKMWNYCICWPINLSKQEFYSFYYLRKQVQLGDQTDSKTLLGTYCCTQTPGEFVWRPGSLTQVNQPFYLLCFNICLFVIFIRNIINRERRIEKQLYNVFWRGRPPETMKGSIKGVQHIYQMIGLNSFKTKLLNIIMFWKWHIYSVVNESIARNKGIDVQLRSVLMDRKKGCCFMSMLQWEFHSRQDVSFT